MKKLASLALALSAAVFASNVGAQSKGIEPVGKVSISGGAEKEQGTPAGGRFTGELLGVIPFNQTFGLQGLGSYVAGRGSRFGLSAGPIMDFGSGKAGLFLAYQYRTFNSNNFLHLRPSVSFYLPQANINLFYSHPLTSPQRDGNSVEYGINQLQATFSYFPASDLASFMRKDNAEFMFGLQANSFAGVGSGNLQSGVGPVFGFAFKPTQSLEVNLVKATIDHHGRYRVQSGLAFYFNHANATLKELRRRYLEPNFFAPNAGGRIKKKHAVVTSNFVN
jgi:hypothetical protein